MIDSEELSRLFAAERAVRSPPGAIEHGLGRFLPAVAANAAPLSVAGGALKVTWTVVSKWILAGFVVGVVGSGAASRVLAPAATHAEIMPPNVTRAPTPVPATSVSAFAPLASLDAAAPSAIVAPRTAPHGSPAAAASAEPTRFDAELRLITLAKTELDAGRPHLAKAWLAERAARFPHGVFATDAQALSVLIGCGERRDEAAARRFAGAHPSSPMLERLRRACGSAEPSKSVNDKPAREEPTHEEAGK